MAAARVSKRDHDHGGTSLTKASAYLPHILCLLFQDGVFNPDTVSKYQIPRIAIRAPDGTKLQRNHFQDHTVPRNDAEETKTPSHVT